MVSEIAQSNADLCPPDVDDEGVDESVEAVGDELAHDGDLGQLGGVAHGNEPAELGLAVGFDQRDPQPGTERPLQRRREGRATAHGQTQGAAGPGGVDQHLREHRRMGGACNRPGAFLRLYGVYGVAGPDRAVGGGRSRS